MNETKLTALNCNSLVGRRGERHTQSRISKNRVYFSVLKSHITEAMFPAYLNVLLLTCSMQKPSKGKRVFSDEVVHQGCLFIFETFMNSRRMSPLVFFIPENLHLLRYGNNNHKKIQVVKYRGEPMCHGPRPLG